MRSRSPSPAPRGAIALACAVAAGCGSPAPTTPQEPAAVATPTPGPPPNLILVIADDLDLRAAHELPGLRTLMAEMGTTFSRAYTAHPLCSPSRVSVLTGRYPHNHGNLENGPPRGGYPVFRASGGESATVATALEQAGYRTALIGKYMNYYPQEFGGRDAVPPGWSRWFAHITSFQDERYYNYWVNEEGVNSPRGQDPSVYDTDVLAGEAEAFIRQAAGEAPFFVYVGLQAPHAPATPADRHRGLFQSARVARVPSFAEADVSDKPAYVQNTPQLTANDVRRMDQFYGARLATMASAEELIGRLLEVVEELGEAGRTHVLFTSDSGMCMGEHRLLARKDNFYEESIQIPLLVRGPGIGPGRSVEVPVVNVDIAPTLLDLAGVPIPGQFDGRSLRGLLQGTDSGDSWSREVLVEGYDADLEAALRTDDYLYAELSSREVELYDMRSDPYQLENLKLSADPALLESLSARLAARRACNGAACRE